MAPELNYRLQTLIWIGILAAMVWLLFELSPILTPFLLAAILAYICDPLVDRMQNLGVPRAAGTVATILLLVALLVLLVLILVPLVTREATLLGAKLPGYITTFQERVSPWLQQHLGMDLQLDVESVRQLLTENSASAQKLVGRVLQSVKLGGLAIFGLMATLLLVPVVMFYLLRDWNDLGERIARLIPRPMHDRALRVLGDIDSVMAEFLRGQLMVMLVLAIYYSIGLWIAGVQYALPVGLLTGLLVFIPYVGYASGLTLALLVALLQFQGWGVIVGVAVVYGIGQFVESFLLTPFLVGDRIGLHPLAVIFALMAFGQLFGFVGVLIALPASAALLVGLREMQNEYMKSPVYLGDTPPDP
jgi:predicted PurR-regulated permease PerM